MEFDELVAARIWDRRAEFKLDMPAAETNEAIHQDRLENIEAIREEYFLSGSVGQWAQRNRYVSWTFATS